MNTLEKNLSNVQPKATPTAAEIAAWESLTQEEQLRRLQASFADPGCSRMGSRTMDELLAAARAAALNE